MDNEIHAQRLMKMAEFLRMLVPMALKYNGEQPHWEAERVAEYEACEAGAAALRAIVDFTRGDARPQ